MQLIKMIIIHNKYDIKYIDRELAGNNFLFGVTAPVG